MKRKASYREIDTPRPSPVCTIPLFSYCIVAVLTLHFFFFCRLAISCFTQMIFYPRFFFFFLSACFILFFLSLAYTPLLPKQIHLLSLGKLTFVQKTETNGLTQNVFSRTTIYSGLVSSFKCCAINNAVITSSLYFVKLRCENIYMTRYFWQSITVVFLSS